MIRFICAPCAEAAEYLAKTGDAYPPVDSIVHQRCAAVGRDKSWCDCQHVPVKR